MYSLYCILPGLRVFVNKLINIELGKNYEALNVSIFIISSSHSLYSGRDSNILAGTAIFHKGGVRDCNFQNPSENPASGSWKKRFLKCFNQI